MSIFVDGKGEWYQFPVMAQISPATGQAILSFVDQNDNKTYTIQLPLDLFIISSPTSSINKMPKKASEKMLKNMERWVVTELAKAMIEESK